MGNTKTPICVFIATFLMIGALILSDQIVSADCKDEKTQKQIALLTSKCGEFIKKEGPKTLPSKQCCDALKGSDDHATCSCVTKEVEAMISMEKVVYIARKCGKHVPAGTKCGSYTVPPPRTL
ncbi:Bifunctional inhibitor/lipid-transfer protein/seed storage 2S albumin superfamily protein [Euphorbia peplus]|nr:Bifunctional inhibitor/lipid-transfer protein/seed storage 2S albumin superfamily protein [Euphorbia peplus]